MTSPHYGYWTQPAMSGMQTMMTTVPPGSTVPVSTAPVNTATYFQTRVGEPPMPGPPPPGYAPATVPRQQTLFYPPAQHGATYFPSTGHAPGNPGMMPPPMWQQPVPVPQPPIPAQPWMAPGMRVPGPISSSASQFPVTTHSIMQKPGGKLNAVPTSSMSPGKLPISLSTSIAPRTPPSPVSPLGCGPDVQPTVHRHIAPMLNCMQPSLPPHSLPISPRLRLANPRQRLPSPQTHHFLQSPLQLRSSSHIKDVIGKPPLPKRPVPIKPRLKPAGSGRTLPPVIMTDRANKGDDVVEQKKIIAKRFIDILESHGPQEVSSESILNCFLRLTTYERKIVMVPGSIKAFLRDMGVITVEGSLMAVEQSGVQALFGSSANSSLEEEEEMDSQQLMFEQKANQHNIKIEVAPSRRSRSSHNSFSSDLEDSLQEYSNEQVSLSNPAVDNGLGEEEVQGGAMSMTSGAAWSQADGSEQLAAQNTNQEDCFYSDEECEVSDIDVDSVEAGFTGFEDNAKQSEEEEGTLDGVSSKALDPVVDGAELLPTGVCEPLCTDKSNTPSLTSSSNCSSPSISPVICDGDGGGDLAPDEASVNLVLNPNIPEFTPRSQTVSPSSLPTSSPFSNMSSSTQVTVDVTLSSVHNTDSVLSPTAKVFTPGFVTSSTVLTSNSHEHYDLSLQPNTVSSDLDLKTELNHRARNYTPNQSTTETIGSEPVPEGQMNQTDYTDNLAGDFSTHSLPSSSVEPSDSRSRKSLSPGLSLTAKVFTPSFSVTCTTSSDMRESMALSSPSKVPEFRPRGVLNMDGSRVVTPWLAPKSFQDANIQTYVTSVHREDKCFNTSRLKRRHVGMQVQGYGMREVAINTVTSELEPVVVTRDQAVQAEVKMRNRRLQVGFPRLGASVEAGTGTEAKADDEFIETIDSLQYDEMVNRAVAAEEALLNLRLQMRLLDGVKLVSQLETAFLNLSQAKRESVHVDYDHLRKEIEMQMQQMQQEAVYNLTQLRDGAWLNTLSESTLTVPEIPVLLQGTPSGKQSEATTPEEFHDARSSPLLSDAAGSQQDLLFLEAVSKVRVSNNPPASEHIASTSSSSGESIRKPPGLEPMQNSTNNQFLSELSTQPGSGDKSASHTSYSSTVSMTSTTNPAAITSVVAKPTDPSSYAHLLPLLQPMMMSLARVNPGLALQPQLLQSTAMRHLLTMQQAGMVPGCPPPPGSEIRQPVPPPPGGLSFPGVGQVRMPPLLAPPVSSTGSVPRLNVSVRHPPNLHALSQQSAIQNSIPNLMELPGPMTVQAGGPPSMLSSARGPTQPLTLPQQTTIPNLMAMQSSGMTQSVTVSSTAQLQHNQIRSDVVSSNSESENDTASRCSKESNSRPPGFGKLPADTSHEEKNKSQAYEKSEAETPESAITGTKVNANLVSGSSSETSSSSQSLDKDTNKTDGKGAVEKKGKKESQENHKPATKKDKIKEAKSKTVQRVEQTNSGNQQSQANTAPKRTVMNTAQCLDVPTEEDWADDDAYSNARFVLGKSKVMKSPTRPTNLSFQPSEPVPAVDSHKSKPLPASMVPKARFEGFGPQQPSPDSSSDAWPSLGGSHAGESKAGKGSWAENTSSSTTTVRKLKPLPIVASSIPDSVPVNKIEFSDWSRGVTGTVESAPSARGSGDGPEKPKKGATANTNTSVLKEKPASKSKTNLGSGALNGLDDFDIEPEPGAEDSEWQEFQGGKRNKKKPKFRSIQTGVEGKENSNFDRLVAQMLTKFPNLTRADAILLIRQIRIQRGDFKGAKIADIFAEASLLLQGKQRWKSSGGEVNESKNINMGNLLYKTSICEYWKAGTCVNGDKCIYAHGRSDLRQPPKHILCSNWKKLGRCPHGSNCLFAHGESELTFPPSSAVSNLLKPKAKSPKEKKAPPVTAVSSITWANVPNPHETNKYQGESEDSDDGGEECTICCDPMSQRKMKKLECGHEFHVNCITRWIEGEERTCPLCRSHALLIEDYPYLGQ